MGTYCEDEIIDNVLEQLFKSLGKDNDEIFLSEADFQFCFAQELNKYLKKKEEIDYSPKIILEYPYRFNKSCGQGKSFIDLYFEYDNDKYFIEFKYKLTNILSTDNKPIFVTRYNNSFDIKPQGASNNGRYFIYRDIERMEEIKKQGYKSFVIFITNDSQYWRINQLKGCQCFNYPLADPEKIEKKYKELPNRTNTKCKTDFENENCKYSELNIEYRYAIKWNDIKTIKGNKNSAFRILVIDCNNSEKINKITPQI